MIVSWLAYALVVSALASAAAWLAERGLAAQGWPTRPAWAAAILVSVVTPVVAWLRPDAPAPAHLAGVPGAFVLGALTPTVAAVPAGPSLETVLLAGWGVATIVLLATVVVLGVRLALRQRRWPARVVDGVEVRVSRRTGPAALGLVRGRVVIPEWALELEPGQRALLLLHESEHVRARDPQLAVTGLLACVAAPWNLPLWWQLRRLRLSIEVDCDTRVLGRAGDAHGYGSLLLAVGQRRAHLALALAEPRSMLERRIRMIARKRAGRAWVRAGALMIMAGVALAAACETPSPTDSREAQGAPAPGEAAAAATGGAGEGAAGLVAPLPGCIEFTIDGTPATKAQVQALNPDRIAGVVVMKGEAAAVQAGDSNCGVVHVTTEDAAHRSAAAGEATQPAGPQMEADQGHASAAAAAGPTFTHSTRPPRVLRGDQVARLLQESYPPLLREAGIGGTANVWFFVDEGGGVANARINRSSGRVELDEAALDVARRMEFEPAVNGDEPVAVWVALDIRFEVQ